MVWRWIQKHVGDAKIARHQYSWINYLFKKKYSNPLRQPSPNLTHGVYLKHCWGELSISLSVVSMLERLVLKNVAQRTSQRVKWTSGARVMFFLLVATDRSKIPPYVVDVCLNFVPLQFLLCSS